MFEPSDLYEGSNMHAVLRTVIALSRSAAKRPAYQGPLLDVPVNSYRDSVAVHRSSILSSSNRVSSSRALGDGAEAKRGAPTSLARDRENTIPTALPDAPVRRYARARAAMSGG